MDSTEGKQVLASKSEKYMLIVSKTGQIKWHYQTLSKSLCQIDRKLVFSGTLVQQITWFLFSWLWLAFGFPFDEQVCSLKIRSWSRDKNMLNLKKRNLKVKVKENIKTEWFIVDSQVLDDSYIIRVDSRSLEFTVLDFQLRLRRVTTYYFVKIIFPYTIISCMTLFTFMLSPESGIFFQWPLRLILCAYDRYFFKDFWFFWNLLIGLTKFLLFFLSKPSLSSLNFVDLLTF